MNFKPLFIACALTACAMPMRDMISQATKATVSIDVKDDDGTEKGTGFLIRQDGYIVTAAHVVDSKGQITVNFSNGDTKPASLIGKDDKLDVAVLKIDPVTSPVLSFGNSDKLLPGDRVVEIGNPFGIGWTVTAGIISGVHRGHAIPSRKAETVSDSIDFIQYDAPTNPGNSGGPVLNEKGEVIGVARMIYAVGGPFGPPQSAGLAFAIPSRSAQEAVTEIMGRTKLAEGPKL